MLKLYDSNQFNILNWRNIVQNAAECVLPCECQSIVPFGFEVTNNRSYLMKNLNRFYCYFGTKSLTERSEELEEEFIKNLFQEIKKNDVDFLNRISVVVFEHDKKRVNLVKDFSDDSIMINVEQRIFENDLLTDYASYLACCLFEIQNNTLSEFNRYHDNLNVRNRCYQLYLIIEYATQYLGLPFTEEEQRIFQSLHRINKSHMKHYYTSRNYLSSTTEEQHILSVIKNRLTKVYYRVLDDNDGMILLRIKAYNNDIVFEHELPLRYYNNFTHYIKTSYLNFE